ncbi:hypothetical protein [Sodalis sp.]
MRCIAEAVAILIKPEAFFATGLVYPRRRQINPATSIDPRQPQTGAA